MSSAMPTYWTDNYEPSLFNGIPFPIKDLPADLLIKVFSRLKSRETVDDCMLVCKKWHDLIKDDEGKLKQKHHITVTDECGHGRNKVLYIDFHRKGEPKTIRLDFQHLSLEYRRIFTTSKAFDMEFEISEATLPRFQEDLKAISELTGHISLSGTDLVLSGTVYQQMNVIREALEGALKSSKITIFLDISLESFNDFWISHKLIDMLEFKSNFLEICFNYGLFDDIDAFNTEVSDAIIEMISCPARKSHVTLSLGRIPIEDHVLELLSAVVEGFKRLRRKEDFFRRFTLFSGGVTSNCRSMLSTFGFTYVRSEILNKGYDISRTRIYRLKHSSLDIALEAQIRYDEWDSRILGVMHMPPECDFRCVELSPEFENCEELDCASSITICS